MRTIAIIAEDGARVFRWTATRAALDAGEARLVFFTECPENTLPRRWSVLPARLAWRFVQWLENRRIGAEHRHYDPGETIRLPCRFRGHFKDFDETTVEQIRDSGADLVIRLGGRGIYRGSILTAAPNGMISIHHGDNRAFRGGPPGFWEVMKGAANCGYVVQRLTETLDGGQILARGSLPARRYAAQNREALYNAADEAMAGVVTTFLKTGRLPDAEPPAETLGPIYKFPGLSDIAVYLWRAWLRPTVDARGTEPA